MRNTRNLYQAIRSSEKNADKLIEYKAKIDLLEDMLQTASYIKRDGKRFGKMQFLAD